MTVIEPTPAPVAVPMEAPAPIRPEVVPAALPAPQPPAATPPAPIAAARTDAAVRVLLVEELDQLAAKLGAMVFDDENVQLVETVTEGRAAMERIVATQPDVVVIDALVQGQVSGLQVAREMRSSGLATPIVFLTVPEMPVKVSAATGAAEVMTLPFEADALISTIVRVDDAHRGPVVVPPAGTVAVFSAKGGVGRTAIAHNLAVALDRPGTTRTVLVDGDQVHGDLRLHLEAPDEAPSLVQLPTGHVANEDVMELLWQDATGLNVLLAPPRMEQADLIMLADVRTGHSMLRRMFDIMVIDVPAVMNDSTLAMLDDADVVLDVTTPRHGAVRKTQRCHAVLTAAGFPMDKLLTVVNHADAGFDPAAFETELGWPADAILMHDERLASGAIGAGSSIITTHPDSLFSRGFADLAATVLSRIQVPSARLASRAA